VRSPASLDVVEDTVRREFGAQERRADAADTRAGLVLGFSGLIVSLGAGGGWVPFALTARFLAGAAGLVALGALSSWSMDGLHPGSLLTRLDDDPVQTRLRVLATELDLHRLAHRRLTVKLARVRLAARLVTLALAFSVLGVTVEMIV
jgi:hypothetical protein